MDARFFLIAILSLGLSASPQGNPDAAKLKNPIPPTPESIAAGKQAYTKCASCHGINGEGGPGNDLIPAAPSLVGQPLLLMPRSRRPMELAHSPRPLMHQASSEQVRQPIYSRSVDRWKNYAAFLPELESAFG